MSPFELTLNGEIERLVPADFQIRVDLEGEHFWEGHHRTVDIAPRQDHGLD
jgi:hypothetical protein